MKAVLSGEVGENLNFLSFNVVLASHRNLRNVVRGAHVPLAFTKLVRFL